MSSRVRAHARGLMIAAALAHWVNANYIRTGSEALSHAAHDALDVLFHVCMIVSFSAIYQRRVDLRSAALARIAFEIAVLLIESSIGWHAIYPRRAAPWPLGGADSSLSQSLRVTVVYLLGEGLFNTAGGLPMMSSCLTVFQGCSAAL
eukprot:TRINITY_DN18675_c0_g1_i2.p1 TRINITY_DN18675_c0_g1~~TRINITY_DN18675_c0_g1_i2.p1  ORF type:complete len:148 (+),score=15.54 TRINITY_DN18675_c0_g1_i2:243-686(+)